MAEPTNADLQKQITELSTTLIKPLKDYAEKGAPSKLVTEQFLTAQLAPVVTQIEGLAKGAEAAAEKAAEEAPKAWEQRLEKLQMGFLIDPIKALLEGGLAGLAKTVAYLVAGLAIAAIIAAVAVSLKLLFTSLSRNLMEWWTSRNGGTARIVSRDPNTGLPTTRRSRSEVENPGGLTTLTTPPNPDTLNAFQAKLNEVNPLVKDFNQEVRKFPKPGELTKLAGAIEKLDAAIRRLNAQLVKDAAAAIRNLKGALRNFNPADIPKPGPLNGTARAAGNLNSAVRTLTGSLGTLSPALRELSSAAAGTTRAVGT
ncbi:hypothetical protein [Streptomyces sp. NPDC051546]|uniref:hypothetical protein n=1 Tax=Streptomyces sp. NPDC051546 TaxID=3365655 RepID=UPI00378E1887